MIISVLSFAAVAMVPQVSADAETELGGKEFSCYLKHIGVLFVEDGSAQIKSIENFSGEQEKATRFQVRFLEGHKLTSQVDIDPASDLLRLGGSHSLEVSPSVNSQGWKLEFEGHSSKFFFLENGILEMGIFVPKDTEPFENVSVLSINCDEVRD